LTDKILVSMIAYREKYLAESVRSCYEEAANPENLIFSIVSEQYSENLHADLSFIPSKQLIYKKLDLSEYRGVLWSRNETTKVNVDYDYILYTCGHNRFAPDWDVEAIKAHKNAKILATKPLITFIGPDYLVKEDGKISIESKEGVTVNMYRPNFSKEYVPGYSFPDFAPVPSTDGSLVEERYLQFSWVFAPKSFVDEVPLDPDMNYHGEEIYVSVQSWCRGWRFFASPVVMYYHDTYKEYPGELLSRMSTHRPWSDGNKDAFWEQSDKSMLKLNKLLSGRLDAPYGEISKELVLNYCEFSGLNPRWTEADENYDKLTAPRHAQDFRLRAPTILD
jgi:hypothetical protein